MHRAKAKSAPPRLKSKFVKNRTNAMKEIEAWVRKDNESFAVPEASRMSGQLSDNVTEERMLKAKLYELSKERYKFLSQNMYEKKVFQDRQQKKANLRRVVSASADGRQRQPVNGEATRGERRSSFGDATSQRPRIRNARLALLERLDPTKGKKSTKKKTSVDLTSEGAAKSPGHKVALSRGNSSASVLNKYEREPSPRHIDSKASNAVKTSTKPSVSTPNAESDLQRESQKILPEKPTLQRTKSSPLRRPMFSDKGPTANSQQGIASSNLQSNSSFVVESSALDSPQQAQQAGVAVTWQARSSADLPLKYGMKIESKTKDPRYSSLERRLCPLVRSKTTGDIHSIVSNMESLHVRPKKRPTDANRSKIEVKAWEFMKEKGFAF